MSLPLFIAKRHIFGHHRIGYISFISIISIAGLAVGVAALILTISILNGFENEIKHKLIQFDSHIRLRLFYQESMDSTQKVLDILNAIDEIETIVPYTHDQVILRYGRETDGVILEGIPEEDLRGTLHLGTFLREGELRLTTTDGQPGIIMGQKLARQMGIAVGARVFLFRLESTTGFGRRPVVKSFTITGLYDSGVSDYDDIFLYTDITAAQDLFKKGATFSGYQLILRDANRADQIAALINQQLGYPYHALSWNDLHLNLFEWLRVQRLPIIIVFGLIAAVALFNIISSLMMIVIEKTRDIGILKSMGFSPQKIVQIFLFEGIYISILGIVFGFGLSLGLAWLQNRYHLIAIPADVYFMNHLPVMLNWKDFLLVGIAGFICSMLATLYPTLKALHLDPVEAIRYE